MAHDDSAAQRWCFNMLKRASRRCYSTLPVRLRTKAPQEVVDERLYLAGEMPVAKIYTA